MVLAVHASAQVRVTGRVIDLQNKPVSDVIVKLVSGSKTLAADEFSFTLAPVNGAPIKQSASVLVSMLGGWIVSAAFCASYLRIGYRLGAAPFMAAWTALFAVAAWLLASLGDRLTGKNQ